jgi:hypothetical protein
LARYVARPALSLKRLEVEKDGRIMIRFKNPWRNGRSGVRLEPKVFLLRIASLVPPPRVNWVRYHGYFAPASALRSRIIPVPPEESVSRPGAGWIKWATLLFHVFGRQPDLCPFCGESMTRRGTLQGSGRALPVLEWIETHGDLIEVERPP